MLSHRNLISFSNFFLKLHEIHIADKSTLKLSRLRDTYYVVTLNKKEKAIQRHELFNLSLNVVTFIISFLLKQPKNT